MSKPLAIAMVCYPSYGGSGIVATELAIGMARRGHAVELIATAPPARFRDDEPNLRFHAVRVPYYPLFEHQPYTLSLASTIAEVCRRQRIQLLHTHYAVPHVVSALLASQALGSAAPRLITTLHGTDVSPVGNDPTLQPMLQMALMQNHTLTVPSRHLREQLVSELQLPAERDVEVISNFVDIERFRPAPSREPLAPLVDVPTDDALPLVIHVSNFRPLKRVIDVVEVFARVVDRTPARLLLVGDGPDRKAAQARLRALGLLERAHFVGNRGDVSALLRCADLMLLPSQNESFGLAALEALSCGVPVIASRVGGLEELITHGQNGFLAPPGDLTEMAEHALTVLTEPTAAASLRATAREMVEARWQSAPILDRYEACYWRTLAAGVEESR